MNSDALDNPTVTLAGQTFDVLPIAFREASKIVPLVGEVFSRKSLSEETLEGMAKIVFYGIKRGAPGMTLDALLDLPVSITEMTEAALVVCKQAGLRSKDSQPGEATGAQSPLPTSTS